MPTNDAAPTAQMCVCGHWPLDSTGQIQKAALALRDLAKTWDEARNLLEETGPGRYVCLDVTVMTLDDVRLDILLLQTARVPDAVFAIVRAVAGLARDFVSVKEWLIESSHTASQSRRSTRVLAFERHAPVHDYHRVMARDWLAADMNASIAWLLGRAGRVLTTLNLSPDAVKTDLLGASRYQTALIAAADILDRAAVLAQECAQYVEEFNQRWSTLRANISAAAALYPLHAEPLPVSATPLRLLHTATAVGMEEAPTAWPVFTPWAAGGAMPLAA